VHLVEWPLIRVDMLHKVCASKVTTVCCCINSIIIIIIIIDFTAGWLAGWLYWLLMLMSGFSRGRKMRWKELRTHSWRTWTYSCRRRRLRSNCANTSTPAPPISPAGNHIVSGMHRSALRCVRSHLRSNMEYGKFAPHYDSVT